MESKNSVFSYTSENGFGSLLFAATVNSLRILAFFPASILWIFRLFGHKKIYSPNNNWSRFSPARYLSCHNRTKH